MSCNAHNHPSDCNCGWGGVCYGRVQPSPSAYIPYLKRLRSSGLLQPNANCPICGNAVYFYESPYGGRVFFDELAPPWPKHPCTDTHWARSGGKLWTGKSSNRYYRTSAWPELIDAQLHNGSPVSRLTSKQRVIYIRFETSLTLELIQIDTTKPREHGLVLLSLLLYDPIKKEWHLAQGFGCTNKGGKSLLQLFEVTSFGRSIPKNVQPVITSNSDIQTEHGVIKRSRAYSSAKKMDKPSVFSGYLNNRPIR